MSLLNLGIKAFQYAPRAMAGVRSLLSDPVKSTGLVTGGILGGKATEETINSGILGNSNMIQEGMNFFSSPAINFLNDIRNTPSGSILTPDQGAIDAENKFNEELNKKITTATQDNQSNILITPEVEQPSGLLTTPEIDPLDFSNTTPMPDQSLLSDYILTAEEAPETEEGLLSESSNPYYSVLAEAVLDMNFNSGSGQQILNQINNMPGIKQSEIVDTGLDNFLSSKDKVTKEELDNYILENNISTQINDKFLGEKEGQSENLVAGDAYNDKGAIIDFLDKANTFEQARIYIMNDYDLYQDFFMFLGNKYNQRLVDDWNNDKLTDTQEENYLEEYLNDKLGVERSEFVNDTRYGTGDLVVPGGENYKEILISLPTNEKPYVPSHFAGQVPEGHNLIAHARFNEREINGKKTLFIEEIQSDLHQQGRKEGYTDNNLSSEIKELEDRQFAKELEMRDLIANFNNLAINRKNIDADEYSKQYNALENSRKEINREILELSYQANKLRTNNDKKIPNTPFKKNWHELTIKRLIKYAVDNGFEAISLTPGQIQKDRYDLSKQISKVEIQKAFPNDSDNTYIRLKAYGKDGDSLVLNQNIFPEKLSDYVGKDLADKINEDRKNKDYLRDGSALEYSGLDLQVGGEGMIGFYDNMLPSFINKFSKKYGAKLEEGSFGNKEDGAVSFDSGATFDYKGTKLKNAKTIDDVYSIVKEDDYLMSEFKLYLRDGLNESDPDSLLENENDENIQSYMNEWLINDYGMEIGTSNFTTVPILEFTPKMIEEIGKKGITLAKLNSGLLSVA
jgi:hypothetical protein